MIRMRVVFLAGLLALSACQSASVRYPTADGQVIAPALAVMAAADAAPQGYAGTFGFTVLRADMVGPRLFLNSYPDYRDQRNLSIAIDSRVLPALRDRYGKDLRAAFLNHEIRVVGVARKTRIAFTVKGRPTDKYYFQTHVAVTDPNQILIVG
jgi:hypothetical protein